MGGSPRVTYHDISRIYIRHSTLWRNEAELGEVGATRHPTVCGTFTATFTEMIGHSYMVLRRAPSICGWVLPNADEQSWA